MRVACLVMLTLGLCALSVVQAFTQQPTALRDQVRSYRAAHEKQIVGEFTQLLSLPNRAADTAEIERNAQAIEKMLQARGVRVRLLRIAGAPPLVYGELQAEGKHPAVGIYAHYDGQPVAPKQWRDPPFSPVMRDASGQ